MDSPTVVVEDGRVDVTLASRLVTAALDQILFFKGQIPMPMARLPLLPAQPGDRSAKKRKEFLDGHQNLVQDITGLLRAASCAFSGLDDNILPAVQAVFVLGTLSVPRARFVLSLEGLEASVPDISVTCTAPNSPEAVDQQEEDDENDENDEEPPESDSESEDSREENPRSRATLFATPQPMRSSFMPFSDESSPSSSPLPASSTTKYSATSRIALFGTPPEPSPLALRHSDENAMSKSNIERRFKASERDLCLKIARMDGIIEDVDATKLQVYVSAPRTVGHDRWLPRATLCTKLDNIMREGLGQNIAPRGKKFYNKNKAEKPGPKIDGLRITCALANPPLTCRSPVLQPKNVEAQEVVKVDDEEGENMWFQWDGKLSGIPVEP